MSSASATRPRPWERANPRDALIERVAWNRWRVSLPDGEHVHDIRLEREHGAYVGDCHVVDTPAGWFVRVQRGNGEKYRETPLTDALTAIINAYADVRDAADDTPLVPRTTRTVRDWVATISEQLHESTGDDGWSYLSAHDLRRTWGTLLVDDEGEPGLVMEWSGWVDWETFREAYLGTYSTKAKNRARENVGWL